MAIRLDPDKNETAALMAAVPAFAGKTVLEVGCGSGRLTRQFAHLAAHVEAIDPDPDLIATARDHPDALMGTVRYSASSLTDFVPSGLYDVIILSWSL